MHTDVRPYFSLRWSTFPERNARGSHVSVWRDSLHYMSVSVAIRLTPRVMRAAYLSPTRATRAADKLDR